MSSRSRARRGRGSGHSRNSYRRPTHQRQPRYGMYLILAVLLMIAIHEGWLSVHQ